MASFAIMFMSGALLTFALGRGVGELLNVTALSGETRLAVATTTLFALAALDLYSVRKKRYCPLGWRRQTPRHLVRHFRITAVASIWGFDTGLAVTTFRVAAVTWAALLLSALGFAPWWSGLAYGAAFTLPFLLLLWRRQLGDAARQVVADPGLEELLQKRGVVQAASAVLLTGTGAVLLSLALG